MSPHCVIKPWYFVKHATCLHPPEAWPDNANIRPRLCNPTVSEAWGSIPVAHGTLSCVAPWLGENVQHVMGWKTASSSWLSWLFFSNDSSACASSWHRRLLGQIPVLNQQILLCVPHNVHQRATLSRPTRVPPGYQYQALDACPLGTEERIS